MIDDVLMVDQRTIRGTDSNSLLRMYDLAHDIFARSGLQQQRARASKAIERITSELQKRNIRCERTLGAP